MQQIEFQSSSPVNEIVQQAGCLYVENHILRITVEVTGYDFGYRERKV